MERHFLLMFRTNTGQMATIRLPYGKEDPTKEELIEAMDRIIATGIVDVIAGELTGRDKVSVVSTDFMEISLT